MGDKINEIKKAMGQALNAVKKLKTGNILGAAKEVLKSKVLKKRLIISTLSSILPILIAVIILFSIGMSLVDKMSELLSSLSTTVSGLWQWMTDDYWIDLGEKIEYTNEDGETESYTLVDKYIKELGNVGASLKDLRLLGEADYSNEDKLLEDGSNKELVEKYIAEFVRADLITQEFHKRRGDTLVSEKNQNLIDGGVYLYRSKKEQTITENQFDNGDYEAQNVEVTDKDYKQMEYVDIDTFQQMVQNNDGNIRYKYSLDRDTGELLVAKITTTTVVEEDVSNSINSWFADLYNWLSQYRLAGITNYEVEEVRIPYKDYISKYTMPYEFLINLCEWTQNPEFAYHVALLARNTKIILAIQDDTTIERETVETEEDRLYYENPNGPSTSGASTSEPTPKTKKTRKVTTVTTQSPVLTIEYADTWSFYEEFNYTKNIKGQLTEIGPIVENPPIPSTLSGYQPERTEISYEASDGAYEGVGVEVHRSEYWYDTFVTERRTKTQMITTTTTYNEPILENSVEKSKQFLGLLRNDSGKCPYDCFEEELWIRQNPLALYCSKEAEFNREGTNVKYKIPNIEREESPLNKLTSAIQLLYANLQTEDIDPNKTVEDYEADQDYKSVYNQKMQGLVEHLRYLMTFPENEVYTIKDLILENLFGDDDYDSDIKLAVDDLIVKTDEPDALPEVSKEELTAIIYNSSYSMTKKNKALSLVDTLIEGQNNNHVNPIFMLAVAKQETSIGTANTSYVKQHNNWTSYNLGKSYSSPQENMETTINAIANGSHYFTQGKYTIREIGYTYCPNTEDYPTQGDGWILGVTKEVIYLYSLIGEDISYNTGGGYDYIYTSSSGISYKVYRQNDYPNISYGSGTIASKGCGLTSDATLLSGYGCEKNPEQLLNGRNIISIHGELSDYRLSVTRKSGPNSQDIETTLNNGKPVIVHVNSSSSYTHNEHWMPLLDIRERNGEVEVYVANPNRNGKDGWDKLSNVLRGCIEYIIVN